MISKAPLRVSFGGGGTDLYPYRATHGGCTLGVAIKKYASATVGGNGDTSSLVLAIKNRMNCLDDISVEVDGLSTSYSGLGASAAVAVSIIGLIAKGRMSKKAIAEMAFDVERNELGVKGGYQDQILSTFGGFQYIEFGENRVNLLPMSRSSFTDELERRLLLVFIGGREGAKSGSSIQEDVLRRDNIEPLNRIKEICNDMRYFLRHGKLHEFGELLDLEWQEKRKLSPLISSFRIDELYEEVKKNGAIGGKITGAGGGGHMLLLCDDIYKCKSFLRSKGYSFERVEFDWKGLENIND